MPMKAGNLIYINLDGFDFDYIAWAKEEGCPIPNLDALIAGGVLFRRACSGIPTITNPMQTSIVTGAWPATHGNTYRYFDPATRRTTRTARRNSAQTIAEAAGAEGLNVASIQQFTLQDRGASYDDPAHLYIQPNGSCVRRFREAAKLVRGEPVARSENDPTMIRAPKMPEFMAIYADDLDSAGHNESAAPAYGSVARAADFAGWKRNIARVLSGIDEALGELVRALEDAGAWEKTAIAIASDHGMAYREDESSLPSLLGALDAGGFSVAVLDSVAVLGADGPPPEGADIVALGLGLQVQLSFARAYSEAEMERLVAVVEDCGEEPWFGECMTGSRLKASGAHPLFADLLVSPKSPCHFGTGRGRLPAGGQHDSLACRRVPMILRGPGIREGATIDEEAAIIDLAPTMSRLLGIVQPRQATGRVLEEALIDPRG